MSEINTPQFLNEKEVAALLKVSIGWLQEQRRVNAGPPFYKFNSNVRYLYEELLDWIKKHSKPTATPQYS